MFSTSKLAFAISISLITSYGVAKTPSKVKSSLIKVEQSQSQDDSVLTLNRSNYSYVLSQIDRQVTSVADIKIRTKSGTGDLLKGFSTIHLDGAKSTVDKQLQADIMQQALKQNKTLIFENTHFLTSQSLPSLPFMAKGDVVIIKPGSKGQSDRIYVYGSRKNNLRQLDKQRFGNQDESISKTREIKIGFKTDFNKDSIHTLSMKQRSEVLDDIAMRLDSHSETQLQKSGGSIGYDCPSQARDERLCWRAIVTNVPYQHIDGNADINILHHFSVGQYRTDQATVIAISPHGSANPNMKVDSSTHKAFYLQQVESEIHPTSTDSMQLWSRVPENRVNSGSVTSTTGLTFGIDANASSDPSLGANITYSESQSVKIGLQDWESNTTSPDGSIARWIFQLNYPKSISDWVEHPAFKKARFKDVPNISKYGLQYTTEGIWVGDKNLSGEFQAQMSTVVKNSELYFTKNTIFRWEATRNTWTHTLSDGAYWFNNGWLKSL